MIGRGFFLFRRHPSFSNSLIMNEGKKLYTSGKKLSRSPIIKAIKEDKLIIFI